MNRTSFLASPPQHSQPGVMMADAFADMWRRLIAGMSPTWQRRATENWRLWLTSYADESTARHDENFTFDEHRRLRHRTLGTGVFVDPIEATGGFEVPESIWQSALFQEVLYLFTDVVGYCNDIGSLEKEERMGDPLNGVILLYSRHGMSRQKAIVTVKEIIIDCVKRLPSLRAQLDTATHDLPDPANTNTLRYVDGIANILRANLEWEHTTPRHIAPHNPAYTEPNHYGYLRNTGSVLAASPQTHTGYPAHTTAEKTSTD